MEKPYRRSKLEQWEDRHLLRDTAQRQLKLTESQRQLGKRAAEVAAGLKSAICRGVSSRGAKSSLSRPAAEYSTILARMTSRYGDVYLRAQASSCARSPGDNWTRNGHSQGILLSPAWPRVPLEGHSCQFYTSSYLWI